MQNVWSGCWTGVSSMTVNSKSHSKISLRQAGVLLSVYLLTCSNLCTANESQFEFGGHTKTRLVPQTFPDDSIFHDLAGSTSFDAEADLRLNLDVGTGPWSFNDGRIEHAVPGPADSRRHHGQYCCACARLPRQSFACLAGFSLSTG